MAAETHALLPALLSLDGQDEREIKRRRAHLVLHCRRIGNLRKTTVTTHEGGKFPVTAPRGEHAAWNGVETRRNPVRIKERLANALYQW
jgi:hypothetical protein